MLIVLICCYRLFWSHCDVLSCKKPTNYTPIPLAYWYTAHTMSKYSRLYSNTTPMCVFTIREITWPHWSRLRLTISHHILHSTYLSTSTSSSIFPNLYTTPQLPLYLPFSLRIYISFHLYISPHLPLYLSTSITLPTFLHIFQSLYHSSAPTISPQIYIRYMTHKTIRISLINKLSQNFTRFLCLSITPHLYSSPHLPTYLTFSLITSLSCQLSYCPTLRIHYLYTPNLIIYPYHPLIPKYPLSPSSSPPISTSISLSISLMPNPFSTLVSKSYGIPCNLYNYLKIYFMFIFNLCSTSA